MKLLTIPQKHLILQSNSINMLDGINISKHRCEFMVLLIKNAAIVSINGYGCDNLDKLVGIDGWSGSDLNGGYLLAYEWDGWLIEFYVTKNPDAMINLFSYNVEVGVFLNEEHQYGFTVNLNSGTVVEEATYCTVTSETSIDDAYALFTKDIEVKDGNNEDTIL